MRPLRGLKVLDLSRLLPGPYLTRLLADLGAEVVKIEEPTAPDALRFVPPVAGGHGAAFAALNFGKRCLTLDLRPAPGRALFLELARSADVVVESFRPNVLPRLGLGYEVLAASNPRLVLCSITGYGQKGALASVAGHDLGYMARVGLLELFGPAGEVPAVPGVQVADLIGGAWTAAVGVLAALLERQTTGRGRHLDIAMARGAASLLALESPRRQAGAPEPRGRGMLTGGLPCYRLYRTRDDRFMALAALEPKFFIAFCTRAGCPELAPRGLATGPEGEAAMRELEALFATRTQREWVELLAGTDCCCEPVQTPEEALADPGLGIGTVRVGAALDVIATDVGAGPQHTDATAVGAPGEDRDAVLTDYGVDSTVVEAAKAAGCL